MSRQESLQKAVNDLKSSVPDLEGILLASSDGLPIAYSLGATLDPNRIAAMAATALGLGKRITQSLSHGTLSEASITGGNGQMFIYSVGDKGTLAVITPIGVNIGLIHLEARSAAKEIANLLA